MVRSFDSELIEMQFPCAGIGDLVRKSLPALGFIQVGSVSATASKTTQGKISVAASAHCVAVVEKGTLLARTAGIGQLFVVPPKSVVYLRGPIALTSLAAKGDHAAILYMWHGSWTPMLEPGNQQSNSPTIRALSSRPITPLFSHTLERLSEASKVDEPSKCLRSIGILIEAIGMLVQGNEQVQLAPLPDSIPETIVDLTDQVRRKPIASWPLKEAADMAGYSPFHFSRVFKSLVGFGFHEFVDRCRTQSAVEKLCNTDLPVDTVASLCGFGTTQSMRESIKEYLGLVPSDLRALPQANEIGLI
jgi:AraC-like DNA-binding protein